MKFLEKIFTDRDTPSEPDLIDCGLTSNDIERLLEIRSRGERAGRLSLEQERKLWKAAKLLTLTAKWREITKDDLGELEEICEEVLPYLNPALRGKPNW